VHIQSDKDDRLTRDLSPMPKAWRRTIRRNPRTPAYCETGRPNLRRTFGLAAIRDLIGVRPRIA
jgi:hypothetical protein